MNQRKSRNRNDKNQLDFVSMATGGHVSRQTPNEEAIVRVPQKVTGDIKSEVQSEPKGVAKASPNFKPIAPPAKSLSKEEEQKALAANSEAVKEDETPTKQ